MKKLNNKGYMLIEIILASVITFTVAFSLINLILKLKNTNEDLYNETNILNDKISITKNIMDDIKNYNLIELDEEKIESKRIITIKLEDEEENQIEKRLEITNNLIEYGDYTNTGFKKNRSYYKKEIKNSTEIGEVTTEKKNDTLSLKIPISSIYSKKKYDIMLLFKVKNKPVLSTLQEVVNNEKICKDEYKEDITKIIIEQRTSPIEESIEYVLSEDEKIKGYVKANTIYIMSKEKIKLNSNSANLFSDFKNVTMIEGLENLDTSDVVNMNNMFKGMEKITELELCSFDTSKVTNTDGLFGGTLQLTEIYVGKKWTLVESDSMFTGRESLSFIKDQCQ